MEGYKITDEQVRAEYDALYKAPPTPISHPELFDPLDPPQGWEYDRWHAFWYRTPDRCGYQMQIATIWVSVVLLLSFTVCAILSK